jgi:dTDP-glucose 4,6-dehydratase
VNERRYIHAPKQEVTPRQYFTLLHELYGDNAVVCYCYYLATIFRDIITDSTRSFPILNLYGKKGTGKTELALSLINLFQRNPEVSNLESTTYYAMGDKCAEVSNMLVHFDEYKNSLSKKHIDFLKGIYDSAGRIKRSADGERRESTNVDCGVVLSGQEIPTADIALFSRVLFLESHKSEHTKEETDKYHSFMKLRKMHPTNITVEYTRYRDNFNAGWYNAWKRALKEIKSEVDYNIIGERFINNWAMMLATYYCLSDCTDSLPFNRKMVHDICIDRLKYQHSLCHSTDEIAIFWAMFSKSRQLGDIREGQDYKVDGIIHLAAESHVDRSIKDPFTFAQTNVMGTLSLLQAAKIYWESLPEGYEGKRFYHISTDEVYGALQMTHPEGIPAPFTTKASSDKNHEAYGEEFFLETTKYNPHSPYSASKASSDHFVRAFHDTYGMPTIVTNCSNNYGPYQFPEKLIPLFINNIRHRKPLPVYGKGENVRDWLYVVDHARAIDMIFHMGKIAETYNIGGFNEWKNIDIIKVLIKTVDRLLGRPEGADDDLITYVTDRPGHDKRYAIDSRKLQRELGWEPSLQFEEGIEKTVRWYLDNQEWMDNVTSGDYQKYYENMYKNR